MSVFSPLRESKSFFALFWAQFLGVFNDNFLKNAIVIFITYRGITLSGLDASLLVPLAGGIFIFPFFLFSGTAGQMADQIKKSKIIIWSKALEVLIMILALVGLQFDNYYILLFCLFLTGTQSAFFGPLKYGTIPEILPPNRLLMGNALVSAGTFTAILLGTILGGGLAAIDKGEIYICIALVGVALIGLYYATKVETPRDSAPLPHKIDYTLLRPIGLLLKKLYKDRDVLPIVLAISWFWFIGASVIAIFPLFVRDVMGGDSSVATFFLGLFTIGMGIGSLLVEKVSAGRAEIGIVPIATLGISICLAITYFASDFSMNPKADQLVGLSAFLQNRENWVVLIALFSFSLFGGCFSVPLITIMQERAPVGEIASYIAGNNILNAIFMVASALFLMAVSGLGPRFILIAVAISNIVVYLILYFMYSKFSLRLLAKFVANLIYKIEVKGLEDVPRNGPYIVACNHLSFADWMLVMASVPEPVHFIIDWAYYYLPGGPFLFRQTQLIPIATRKENPKVLEKAFVLISERIKKKGVVGIFPEGAISRNGKLSRIQPGIQKIIKNDPCPVVYLAIDGIWGSILSFEGGKVIKKWPSTFRRKVTITFSRPVAPENYSPEHAIEFYHHNVKNYQGESDAIL